MAEGAKIVTDTSLPAKWFQEPRWAGRGDDVLVFEINYRELDIAIRGLNEWTRQLVALKNEILESDIEI
jgi:hypothetical protein